MKKRREIKWERKKRASERNGAKEKAECSDDYPDRINNVESE